VLALAFSRFLAWHQLRPRAGQLLQRSPNTKLLVQLSFATVSIMANGWWIFRCHCHHLARYFVCSLIRSCEPIDINTDLYRWLRTFLTFRS
jgi:hypothetical protein